jgi:NCS1 family nucleobase:cation symporter-1
LVHGISGLKYSVIAIIAVVGNAALALRSTLGSSLGQPLIPESKRGFGKAGVIDLSFLSLITNIGPLGVNLLLAVMALQKIVPLNYPLAVLVLMGVTLLVAILGRNFIHAFARWMSIVMGLLFVALSAITIVNMIHIVVASAVTPIVERGVPNLGTTV